MNTVLYGVSVVPAIVGVVLILTKSGVPTTLAPLLDLVLGIGAGFASFAMGGIPPAPVGKEIVEAVIAGIGFGLTASGLYQIPGQVNEVFTTMLAPKQTPPTGPVAGGAI